MFLTQVPAPPASQNVYISKSHSPNGARLRCTFSLLPIKVGEHGLSMNLNLLAGLKYLQSLLWFVSVHTRMSLSLGKPKGFQGCAYPPSQQCSPNQCQFKLGKTTVCVGTVPLGEKGEGSCICAALAPPSGITGPVSLRWMWACFCLLFLLYDGATVCLLLKRFTCSYVRSHH